MKIKIQENSIVFKISSNELSTLLENQQISHTLNLFPNALTASITPHLKNASSNELNFQNFCLNLLVSKNTLQELLELGRHKKGLIIKKENPEILLQLDIFGEK